ncbi:NDP-sugar epimerase, includes UDP-GlcNAc-inverting 4,6-dehydratase FlaA1 and capsular polysaccharide biosynthesis protein EpsC [Poseidonocella pacifica]|uniref:NDP-sugar epimerase, includes UDP-GlcNAc-inverting 4,6-dehydratase FlaA1 and capsular polysaccharide biosynthesis protein EpsC n=1 Tax=Poseidonocella pacifica TaxID=871651 RepID=A0A1I0Y0F3_9RHOB|nr:nucleoside-diphosphate sugar epimerase/dehydratase [Poseidonocella pacifica]SFB06116.1 NDP-sugar epimerase, includes UDP-GlcNAc-inverting 4,6-dehydratase FlaA1 and capsular polysaccharide biosynthesis protein EpsC [Poseidonocella pacifica]
MLYEFCIRLKERQKQAIFLSLDAVCIALAYGLAHLILAGGMSATPTPSGYVFDLSILLPAGLALSFATGLHAMKLNAYEAHGMNETALVAVILTLGMGMVAIVSDIGAPPGIFPIFGLLYLVGSVAARVGLRHVVQRIYDTGKPRDRVLIYGAGQTGQQLATALRSDHAVVPIAFVDDSPTLQSRTICGFKVHSPAKLGELIERLQIDLVVIAIPSASRPTRARITRKLRRLGCEVQDIPSFAELVVSGSQIAAGPAVDLTELLGRSRLDEELPGATETYRGKRILITGAGGSIGAELCRQLSNCGPARLVLIDHSEHALYTIERELAELRPSLGVSTVLGSIAEEGLVRKALERERVDVVFHAAAYKHLPMVESNAIEGVRNNVFGTKVVADCAREAGVERFILVSSDKAVRPTSVMGASKRLAELLVQDLATRSSQTRFSMVRFGNVLGSSGSVIPLFEEQIGRGGPVTLTHEEVTRYFMTISEAVRLVLLAGSFARGGDVFVLDMGAPVPIRQLAHQMIEGAGLTIRNAENPHGDIEVQITGLRRGEKLHEELLIGSDMLTTPHPKILRAQESYISELEIAQIIKALRGAIDTRDETALRALIMSCVARDAGHKQIAAEEV